MVELEVKARLHDYETHFSLSEEAKVAPNLYGDVARTTAWDSPFTCRPVHTLLARTAGRTCCSKPGRINGRPFSTDERHAYLPIAESMGMQDTDTEPLQYTGSEVTFELLVHTPGLGTDRHTERIALADVARTSTPDLIEHILDELLADFDQYVSTTITTTIDTSLRIEDDGENYRDAQNVSLTTEELTSDMPDERHFELSLQQLIRDWREETTALGE